MIAYFEDIFGRFTLYTGINVLPEFWYSMIEALNPFHQFF